MTTCKELIEHINAMARICGGMTLEEMQNAPFDYKSLLEIVQRREVRNACVPDVRNYTNPYECDTYETGCVDGWNECREAMIIKMGEQE